MTIILSVLKGISLSANFSLVSYQIDKYRRMYNNVLLPHSFLFILEPTKKFPVY